MSAILRRSLVVLVLFAGLPQAPAHAYLKLGTLVNGTVVDVTCSPPRILREGSVSAREFNAFLKRRQ